MKQITPTADEKREWGRMADAAYRTGDNLTGHRLSAAACRPIGYRMDCATYDGITHLYRQMLIDRTAGAA